MKLLHSSDIDRKKYTDCVQGQSVHLLYAQPWYLDAVTKNNWWAVVGLSTDGRYKFVLPFHRFRKWKGFGPSVDANPLLVQQCGPWGQFDTEELVAAIKLIKRNSSYGYLGLSQEVSNQIFPIYEQIAGLAIRSRVNQQVIMPVDNESLLNSFITTRKKHLRRGRKVEIEQSENANECVSEFLKFKGLDSIGLKPNHVPLIQNLMTELSKRGLAHTHHYKVDGVSQLCLVLAQWGEGVISLLGGPVNDGASMFLQDVALFSEMEILINRGGKVFDFEGSNLDGVQKYNSSFGAQIFEYPMICW